MGYRLRPTLNRPFYSLTRVKVEDFFYELPQSAIGQVPAEPRDTARLLDTRDMSDHVFADLPELLRPGDLVVVNTTRVRQARLSGVKSGTGGAVEFLVLDHVGDGVWEGMIRPARRLRVGVELDFHGLTGVLLDDPEAGLAKVDFGTADLEQALGEVGTVPLPPYFTGTLQDDERYQTVFADVAGSAAAPTAGLHFTDEVVAGLSRRGVRMGTVDLHVGIDTFRPMSVDLVEDHKMHAEWCSVPESTADLVRVTKDEGGRVVAVGTTTTRTLETFANDDGTVTAGSGPTDIFLRPGSSFRVTDLLVTNFHVPGSTLVAMIAGFMGEGWRAVYREALERGYRFLSFGDAMLCERQP